MNKRTTILIGILALVVAGLAFGGYLFNKKVPGLAGVTPDFTMSADELFNAFNDDEAKAMLTYENKVILVNGEVMSVKTNDSTSSVVLMAENAMAGGVNCSFKGKVDGVEKGQTIAIKGRCQGFLMDVVLNNSVIDE